MNCVPDHIRLDLESGEIELNATTHERRYIRTKNYIIKGNLKEEEFVRNKTGAVVRQIWARERIQKEFAPLQFMRPIPPYLSRGTGSTSMMGLSTWRLNGF